MSDQQKADLERKINSTKTQIEELSLRLSNAQREARVAQERQAKETSLAADLEQLNADCARLKQENEQMRAEVAEFPTETQVLKLERRVESLKDAIGKYDTEITARMSAVDAYRARRDTCVADATAALGAARELTVERRALVDKEVESEAGIHSSDRVGRDFDAMLDIEGDRENVLAQLHENKEQRAEEDAHLTAKLVDLQGLEEREAPVIDGEAARHAQAITDAWQVEQQALLKTYDKLRQVNREQEFHIARGSHVKREDTTPYAMYHEQALSSRQGHIATQLNTVRAQVAALQAENAFHSKKLKQLTGEGREAREKLEEKREQSEKDLEVAIAGREAADQETAKFRALRWELQDALRAVRNAPALTM